MSPKSPPKVQHRAGPPEPDFVPWDRPDLGVTAREPDRLASQQDAPPEPAQPARPEPQSAVAPPAVPPPATPPPATPPPSAPAAPVSRPQERAFELPPDLACLPDAEEAAPEPSPAAHAPADPDRPSWLAEPEEAPHRDQAPPEEAAPAIVVEAGAPGYRLTWLETILLGVLSVAIAAFVGVGAATLQYPDSELLEDAEAAPDEQPEPRVPVRRSLRGTE